jgi:hypothetical protein
MSEFDLSAESAPPGPLIRLIHDQRVAFTVVGVINKVVGSAMFIACSESVGHLVDHRFGTVAGSLVTVIIVHVLSVLSAFVIHRRVRVPGSGPHAACPRAVLECLPHRGGINFVAMPVLVELDLHRIPGAGNHRGVHHAADLLRPPALLLPAQRRQNKARLRARRACSRRSRRLRTELAEPNPQSGMNSQNSSRPPSTVSPSFKPAPSRCAARVRANHPDRSEKPFPCTDPGLSFSSCQLKGTR